ncbi:MAG: hypothetical protein L6Q81_03485 [Bacteroidia bacterium]|nr:hypothetical protein [Bacteroidia bacterium]
MNAENQPTMLGVYWYFGFPEGLYSFHYFKFFPGYGGHADNPAELNAVISVDEGTQLLNELQRAVEHHPFSYLRVTVSGNLFHISTGGYQLFDFDFRLIEHADQLLTHSQAEVISKPEFVRPLTHQFIGTKLLQHTYPRLKTLQVTGSDKKKSNAECCALRLDCHVDTSSEFDFTQALKELMLQSGINVMYYYRTEKNGMANLMYFFTNGRQGNNSEPVPVQLSRLDTNIEALMKIHVAGKNHLPEIEYPAYGERKIVLMCDEEFIL